MSFADEFYEAFNKKKKKKEDEKNSKKIEKVLNQRTPYENEYYAAMRDAPFAEEDIAPVRSDPVSRIGQTLSDAKSKLREQKEAKDAAFGDDGKISRTWFKEAEGKWYNKALGSLADLGEHITEGAVGIWEEIIDAGAMLGNAMGNQSRMEAYSAQQMSASLTGKELDDNLLDEYMQKNAEAEKETMQFVEKDLYDEVAIAKAIISDPLRRVGIDSEKHSVFGEKTDALVTSAGKLGVELGASLIPGVGQVAATSLMGMSAFGSEAENALKQGASYSDALFSAAVSAGAEILSEKLGGVKFGGKTVTDAMFGELSSRVTGKLGKALLSAGKIGADATAEGLEEIFSGYMNAIGQKLSYMEDKEIEELFSDEDRLDSFIGGAVLGGAFSSVETAISGRDPVSGLTKHEQAVVDKVSEDIIKQQEADGKTLTNREKSQIQKDVLDRLEKGQIDVDTIESTLGGDKYKAYTDHVNTQKQLKDELDELRKMKSGDRNDIQTDRMNELKGMNLDDTTKRDALRKTLDDEMNQILKKNGKLVESYKERDRRGEAFTDDLSQYTGKQRASVERAIKSGVLNNTYRSHELVKTLSWLEAEKGITFDYTNNAKLKESGFAVEGKTVNGYVNKGKDTITLNVQSAKAWQSVVGHEIGHVLKSGVDSQAYTELQNALYEYAQSKGELDSRRAYLTEMYKNMNADIEEELTSDLLGDYLFTDKAFINHLTGNRTLFQKIYDEIKYLCKRATGKELTEIEKVKREFDKAWEQLKVNPEGVSDADDSGEADVDYSISVTDTETLDSLNKQVARGEYDAETNPDGGYYVTYKSMSFWGYDEDGNAILRSPMAEYVDGELSNAYLIPKDKSKLNWYQATETIDEGTGLPSGLMVKTKKEGNKTASYLPASENQDLIKEDWSNLFFLLERKEMKNGKWVKKSPTPARYNPYEHSSNSMLNDQFSAAYLRDNLVTVKMYVPVSEDNGTFRAKYSKDATGWTDWKSGIVATKIAKQKDLQRRVYLSRYAAPVEIVPDSEVAQAYKGYLEGTDVAIPDNVVSPNLLNELKKAGVPIEESGKVKYSVSAETASDSNGNELSLAVQKRFANSKAVDENGRLKVLYHGTASGEFYTFDKSKGSVEGDFGSGFYFTDDESDVESNYEGGGPDFENKVARLAEQIEQEEDIDYSEAEARAREELYKGSFKHSVYLNIENPAIVGETNLFDYESFAEEYDRDDYDSDEDYEYDVEQLIADKIDEIIWDIDRNVDIYSTDGIAEVLWEAINEGGIDIEQLKANINNLYLEDNNGNLVGNEVTRQIIESLGYDGIIDNTVSTKFNMGLDEGTTHYIVFKPNQIKSIDNQNPTDNPDIRYSLSKEGEEFAPIGDYSTPLRELALEEDVAPVAQSEPVASTAEATEAPFPNEISPMTEEEANTLQDEKAKADAKAEGLPKSRKQLHNSIINNAKAIFKGKGFNFDEVLRNAKNLSTFSTVDNTPQRVMEKALGYKEGQALADLTVNKVAQNETEGIKWLNSFTDRKNGLLAQISKQYRIKPGSKESAAAQMYAEGFYVNDNNDIVAYGDAELAKDFPDVGTQYRIKGLAGDSRIRQIYDETLKAINESRARNAYPEIQRLDNYFLHFRAMDDTFSRLGLPFNPNDIRAKDLPTDLNGVTADLKPGQPYFASAMHRTGKRTSFDLLGGLERYLTSAKNQIYHIDDIQTLRALRNYIADTYGQANGLEGIDALSEEEAQERIEQVYNSHLSTFAKFLNEEANVLAGKTALIDRGLEGFIGRRGMTFLDTVNRQVGSNMVGFNVSSSLTNFLPVAQTVAKTNKFDFLKAFTQTVSNKVGSVFGKSDGFAENSPVIIRRKGAERFYRTPFQKVGDAGYVLMSAVDDISTELIARTKFNELTRKGMDEQTAHFETDKWVSRLMGDRSLGQQPQLYNSKTLGVLTKFQLEVRNQLDSQFYDTIQETKVSNEDIENALARNAKTAAKVTSTFVQLAVVQHLFGKAFESVAGYNPAFDIISVLSTMFGFDDDEESEDTALDNIEQGFFELLEDLPYTSTFTGGRIPLANALPVTELIKGVDSYGNEKSRWETLGEAAPYYVLPGGYSQIKKTYQGLNMFSDEHPVSGSYTDSGNLRFPVEDTLGNRVQAALFGQYASENAREYFDNGYAPLKEKQIQEYIDVDMPIKDYWEYREGLKEQETLEDKFDYIAGLDLPVSKKNILINNVVDRKEPVDLDGYEDFSDYEEFDFATKNPEKWDFLQANNISYDEYNASKESREAYNWAYKNPEGYAVSKAVGGDVVTYRQYTSDLYDIKADKDASGKSITGSRKAKVIDYINNLDADYYTKIILYKSEYPSDDSYNADIVNYIVNHSDLTYDDRVAILTELGFRVAANGDIYAD